MAEDVVSLKGIPAVEVPLLGMLKWATEGMDEYGANFEATARFGIAHARVAEFATILYSPAFIVPIMPNAKGQRLVFELSLFSEVQKINAADSYTYVLFVSGALIEASEGERAEVKDSEEIASIAACFPEPLIRAVAQLARKLPSQIRDSEIALFSSNDTRKAMLHIYNWLTPIERISDAETALKLVAVGLS